MEENKCWQSRGDVGGGGVAGTGPGDGDGLASTPRRAAVDGVLLARVAMLTGAERANNSCSCSLCSSIWGDTRGAIGALWAASGWGRGC